MYTLSLLDDEVVNSTIFLIF